MPPTYSDSYRPTTKHLLFDPLYRYGNSLPEPKPESAMITTSFPLTAYNPPSGSQPPSATRARTRYQTYKLCIAGANAGGIPAPEFLYPHLSPTCKRRPGLYQVNLMQEAKRNRRERRVIEDNSRYELMELEEAGLLEGIDPDFELRPLLGEPALEVDTKSAAYLEVDIGGRREFRPRAGEEERIKQEARKRRRLAGLKLRRGPGAERRRRAFKKAGGKARERCKHGRFVSKDGALNCLYCQPKPLENKA